VKKSLPYEYIDKPITPWGGMRMVKEFIDRSGIHEKIKSLPFHEPGSAIGHEHWEIVESFIISVILGAGNCAGSAQLGYDCVIKELFQWKRGMPSQSTLSRFFRKYEQEHADEQIPDEKITIDFDGTVITRYGEQEGAEVGYNPTKKGRKSHHPLIAFAAEPRMVINSWLRAGNSAASSGFDFFLEETLAMLPANKIGLIRADSGFSGNKILSELEDRELEYIISLPLRAGLVEKILNIHQWLPSTTKGISYSSFNYRSKAWGKSRRVVVVRKDAEKLPKCAGKTLFSTEDDYARYRYSAFVTNSSNSAELIWLNYKQRATAENQIKELKYDYALEGFCFQERLATEFAFKWVTIAYNIMSYFRNTIEVSNVKPTLSTLKYQCIAVGAYLTSSGRTKRLMLAAQSKKRSKLEDIFQKISDITPKFQLSTA
jgi:Transposase DDE domain group 1